MRRGEKYGGVSLEAARCGGPGAAMWGINSGLGPICQSGKILEAGPAWIRTLGAGTAGCTSVLEHRVHDSTVNSHHRALDT